MWHIRYCCCCRCRRCCCLVDSLGRSMCVCVCVYFACLSAVETIAYDLMLSEWMDGTMRTTRLDLRTENGSLASQRTVRISAWVVGYGTLCDRMIFGYIMNFNVCEKSESDGVGAWTVSEERVQCCHLTSSPLNNRQQHNKCNNVIVMIILPRRRDVR